MGLRIKDCEFIVNSGCRAYLFLVADVYDELLDRHRLLWSLGVRVHDSRFMIWSLGCRCIHCQHQSGKPATLTGAPAAVQIEAASYSCSNSDSLPLPCTLFIDRSGQVLYTDGN